MRAEKVVLSFVALLLGLIVAGGAFYFLQSSKGVKSRDNPPAKEVKPSVAPSSDLTLTINSPKDEEVVDKKLVTVSGKTNREAIVVVSTPLADEVIKPNENGTFTATITIDDGYNELVFTAIAPNGEEVRKIQTITYSTEDF